jgi:hypothetical protein
MGSGQPAGCPIIAIRCSNWTPPSSRRCRARDEACGQQFLRRGAVVVAALIKRLIDRQPVVAELDVMRA